jgi:hypothetical protein
VEAEKLMYPNSVVQKYCKNSLPSVFTNYEIEEVNERIYFANLYNKEKLARYAEIRDLATVQYPGKFCSN